VLTTTHGICSPIVLHPAGDIAIQERDLILASMALMLIIIVPVMALTVLFASRYRYSNQSTAYDPEWHHSTRLELMIWGGPLVIVACLGALTWFATHALDPYQPISRLAPGRPVSAETRALTVEVVALDWKWLFIYPDLGIATVNELAVPIDTPIDFRITAASVMNSFSIPAMAGQIYAMPGMETQLHGVFNASGTYDGFSANFSGAGFSDMRFRARAMPPAAFAQWVGQTRATVGGLGKSQYLSLAQPSQAEPVRRFGSVDPDLYRSVLNRCVVAGQPCLDGQKPDKAPSTPPVAAVATMAPPDQHHLPP